MTLAFELLLLACLACAGGALAARGADDAGWFGAPAADANLVTTPVVDKLEATGNDNDTATYDDDEYFDAEGEPVVDVEAATATNVSAPNARNSSTAAKAVTPRPRATSSASPPEARRAKAAAASSSSGKTEEVNYWRTDGLVDQPASGSSRTSASEEARDEPQVSVKEHDRNPHPFAFSSSGDNEWFGFGGDGGSSAEAGGGSKSRLGGSASVAVEDYQTKEQGGSREAEVESAVVEIKEHDELAPSGGASSSADGQWFGDVGSSQSDSVKPKSGARPPPASDGGGGDDAWFGVEASEWQPVAASSHRQQRRLNWGEDETPAEGDYEALDIITAPPDTGRSRDVYSFVVESSFGGSGERQGRGSGKKDTDDVDEVEIVTAAPSADLGWFEEAPKPTRKVVVKSRTSTTTVRSTIIGRTRVGGGIVSRNHSFVDLLATKSGAGGMAAPGVPANESTALGVAVTVAGRRQNASAAPPVDSGEDENSVNASPRNQSLTTAPPTTAAPTTTTAAVSTTTPAPKAVPHITVGVPKVSVTAAANVSDRAQTPKPVEARKPASELEVSEEDAATPSTVSGAAETTAATVLPTRSGRTFAEEATPRSKNSQSIREEAAPRPPGGRGDAPANFSAASASSETRTVVLRGGDVNGRLQAGGAPANDNLSYILVGTCCAVSLVCLAVVVAVVRRRKALRRRRHSLHPPFQHGQLYAPTSYSYPPSARAGHFAAPPKDGAALAPPDPKTRMWFMGRKQSPYSLCDQHLSYCSRDAATDYKPADGGRRHSDGGALAKATPPPPPVYRTGFSGLSDARHSSGLDYMNKGEMIYWSSNNEQLI